MDNVKNRLRSEWVELGEAYRRACSVRVGPDVIEAKPCREFDQRQEGIPSMGFPSSLWRYF